jgi:pyruvate/2-oxoglutarate/acetoin dehydrogenase E1 component
MPLKKYSEALNDAFRTVMRGCHGVFHIGVGVTTPWYVGNTMTGLVDEFGEERIIDTPVSENGVTGIAVGAAIVGMHPIVTFPRMDFMYYAMDQIFNNAALLNYTLGGTMPVPITFRGIINRGGEQGAQHSQALQSIFMHVPGLKVVMPSSPRDAKGLLIAALEEPNPVVFIEDRWLYDMLGDVPNEKYTTPIGLADLVCTGKDVTLLASSYMMVEARKAVDECGRIGVSVELIDLRSLKPLDRETIFTSVRKTGRLVIADGTWRSGGVATAIAGIVASENFRALRAPIGIVSLPDLPAPAAGSLEKGYYPTSTDIVRCVKEVADVK